MPDNSGKTLEAQQFTDNQGAPENTEETMQCEGEPASSEGNDEYFVDGGTAMECSVAAEVDRMNKLSSAQEGDMTGGSTVTDNDPFNERLVLKRQLNLEHKKRTQAEKECRSLKELYIKIFADDQLRYLGKGTMGGSA